MHTHLLLLNFELNQDLPGQLTLYKSPAIKIRSAYGHVTVLLLVFCCRHSQGKA